MKNANSISKVFGVSLTLVGLLMLTACPDSGGGGNARSGGNSGTVDVGDLIDGDSSRKLYEAVGNTSWSSAIQLAMVFAAPDGVNTGGYGNYWGGYSYAGPVEAVGYMYVSNGYTGDCNIPSGQYTVTTVTQGQVDSWGTVTGMLLIAEKGGDEVRMRLDYATFLTASPQIVSCANEAFPTEMLSQFTVQTLNGQACYFSSIITNSPQPVACNY